LLALRLDALGEVVTWALAFGVHRRGMPVAFSHHRTGCRHMPVAMNVDGAPGFCLAGNAAASLPYSGAGPQTVH